MKNLAYIALAVGAASLILGLMSRVTINPVNFKGLIPGAGLDAQAFLDFTDTCLLATIALSLLESIKSK